MKTVRLVVHGKVQGVFFRKSTKEKADQLKLTGTVKNLPDGSVEIFATGDKPQLQEFIEWCHEGPPAAEVSCVDIHYLTLKNYSGFGIVH